ncbi:hypothetical protein PTTG_26015 [Puccinia triticina 1-1 BBBD Race 1]|uniref:Uncharacterized protein n=1 Tax=Puccinia triticina (isolate 1-1 / race 1 (BBBD)) TaxID=630390 RepID=A0A180GZ68_PUCT1|nr:hypothetical protein PTTG_26015 [Puccinia triticina 1-1 BBBD Race 1]
MAKQTQNPIPPPAQGDQAQLEQAREQLRIQNAQKLASKNAINRGGLVLGADQAHAFAMSSMLNKVKGIEDLTDKNYTIRCCQVGGSLNSIFLANYLLDINFTDLSVVPAINEINRGCIIEFMYSRMDKTNAARFRTAINDVEIPMVREMIPPTNEELEENPDAQTTPGRMIPLVK